MTPCRLVDSRNSAGPILTLATDGSGTIGVTNSSAAGHHLIVDVNGYFL